MKVNIHLSALSDFHITKELFLLSEIIAKTQTATESVVWAFDDAIKDHPILASLLRLYKESSPITITDNSLDAIDGFCSFDLNPEIANASVRGIEAKIMKNLLFPAKLKVPLSYLLDELVCNMQQHAGCKTGAIYVGINAQANTLDVIVADQGITIYGSYVNAGKYLEYIGVSSAEALSLAKDGYSTKNRPDAENRGYGISSNAKMIVDGLNGVFSILSGSAVYLYSPQNRHQIIGSSDYFEWCGTAVIAQIPLNIPQNFSFYDYIA